MDSSIYYIRSYMPSWTIDAIEGELKTTLIYKGSKEKIIIFTVFSNKKIEITIGSSTAPTKTFLAEEFTDQEFRKGIKIAREYLLLMFGI